MVNKAKDDVFTIDQAAKFLKVGPKTVYNLLSEERVPGKIFAKKVGRSWRIKLEEIDRFLSEEKGSPYQMSIGQTESKIKSG